MDVCDAIGSNYTASTTGGFIVPCAGKTHAKLEGNAPLTIQAMVDRME